MFSLMPVSRFYSQIKETSKRRLEMEPYSVSEAYQVEAWLESESATQQQSRTSSDFICFIYTIRFIVFFQTFQI